MAKGSEYIRTHLCRDLPSLESMVNPPVQRRDERLQSIGQMSSGSGGWDFSVSTDQNPLKPRKETDDPLGQIGSDEEDPLDDFNEEDF
jgi:hypothetical protein